MGDFVTKVELLDFVFSWSIQQVLNKKLYKNKMNQIPDTFSSVAEYLNSFKLPLIEETRADLCSGLESVSESPACEISAIRIGKGHKPPAQLHYKILLKAITELRNPGRHYEPQSGDVFAITNVRPRDRADLIGPGKYIVLAFVGMLSAGDPFIPIVPSVVLSGSELHSSGTGKRLFATFVMNLTTNSRIWKALHPNPRSSSLGLLENVLQCQPSDENEDCSLCISEIKCDGNEDSCEVGRSNVLSMIQSFKLDESQTDAVLSSISMAKCAHRKKNVKLIWGPPGTGKTKTVASLLFALLKLKCKTLTCAPTNIAVLQVAERLVKLFLGSAREYDTYGLGDIVLFGNGERMKIDEHEELVDVFLQYRLDILNSCLDGWKFSLVSMIALLEDPRKYNTYLRRVSHGDDTVNFNDKGHAVTKNAEYLKQPKMKNQKKTKEIINRSLIGNKKQQQIGKINEQVGGSSGDAKTGTETMTFKDFVMVTFHPLARRLVFIAKNMYTHLPTAAVPLNVVKQMILLINLLETLENSKGRPCQFAELMMKKEELLGILKQLLRFPKPKFKGLLKDFCLKNACLIFCTASGSIKVRCPVEMVIIDEAAQLKECESAILFQIPCVRNAILIGDDRQLPAMVQSEVSGRMNFGRSLFQRLATLGKQKHLLNIQYRMHPTISSFPNKMFYENSIIDASNVKMRGYTRNFLKRNMYGSYTFINVSTGKEDFSKGYSRRNVEEAAIVNHIIGKLYSYHCNTKMAISVGVISPYKGQVSLMHERFGKKYAERKGSGFSVNVRSVDGFQGGEEDIIIISTVRCNNNGSVGFLSNHQRTNVALTRARYCLWIVGSGSTLGNSGTVWQDLVADARTRGCFYDADEVSEFMQIAKPGLIKTSRPICRPDICTLELSDARWTVVLSNDFKASLAALNSDETRKQVTEMVNKMAGGWRQFNTENALNIGAYGVTAELLELNKVDDRLYLAWSTGIHKEETKCTQVIQVWNILSASVIPKLVEDLNTLFGSYTVDFVNLCKQKSFHGNLVVPMSWPLHSVSRALPLADPAEYLSSQLANMSFDDNHQNPNPNLKVKRNLCSTFVLKIAEVGDSPLVVTLCCFSLILKHKNTFRRKKKGVIDSKS